MKKIWTEKSDTTYSNPEWLCIKIPFMFFWLVKTTSIHLTCHSASLPRGIFQFFDASFLAGTWWKYTAIIICFAMALMYLLERKMILTTLGLFILSVFTFSLEESNGILNRYSLLSFIFLAQHLAYLLPEYIHGLDATQLRIPFSVQAIAAAYVLSGISKLTVTGISWVTDGKYLALQILKSHYYKYATAGDESFLEAGNRFALFIQNNNNLVCMILAITLVLELFAWLSIGSKKRAFIYGCLLLVMHIGIGWLMDIKLVAISRPMIIFMINPLFLIWIFFTPSNKPVS